MLTDPVAAHCAALWLLQFLSTPQASLSGRSSAHTNCGLHRHASILIRCPPAGVFKASTDPGLGRSVGVSSDVRHKRSTTEFGCPSPHHLLRLIALPSLLRHPALFSNVTASGFDPIPFCSWMCIANAQGMHRLAARSTGCPLTNPRNNNSRERPWSILRLRRLSLAPEHRATPDTMPRPGSTKGLASWRSPDSRHAALEESHNGDIRLSPIASPLRPPRRRLGCVIAGLERQHTKCGHRALTRHIPRE
ncbi:hypothetical protein LIA77_06396 [Sarocladium implicatum]|nr:hypothetical protein LIA77_06396 [Sarocladium implicatum]